MTRMRACRMTPSRSTLASAFVARWCVGAKVETAGGVFQVREDEPAPDRIRHPEGGEIASASGTRDHPGRYGSAWKPAGDLNARWYWRERLF
jgi:hypothetical protein